MGAPTIKSGLNPFQPLSFAVMPNGYLLMANGLNKPQRWDGSTASTENAGIPAVEKQPTITTPTGGGAAAASYLLAYRYTDDEPLFPIPGNLGPTVSSTAAASDRFTWAELQQSTDTRVAYVELYRTVEAVTTAVYFVVRLSHNGSISSIVTDGGGTPKCRINFTAATRMAVGAVFTVSGASVGGYNTSHTVTKVNSLTQVETDIGYTSDATTATWVLTGFDGDKKTDDDISTNGTSSPTAALDSVTNSSGSALVDISGLAHNLCVGDKVSILGASVQAYNTTHTVVSIPSETTFVSDVAYTSNATGGTWSLLGITTGYPIENANGSLNLRKYGVPPNNKAVVTSYLDRSWWLVDVTYDEGTVAASGTAVTGTGTSWTTEMEGRLLYFSGGTKGYLITDVASATSITLSESAGTVAGGTSYAIRSDPTERNSIWFSAENETEAVPPTNQIYMQELAADQDELVGALAYGSYLYLLKDRHIYRFSCGCAPVDDFEITLVGARGAFNHRTWTLAEDTAYIMDQFGVYRFTGQGVDDISEPIKNYFRDGTIDFSKSKWFHAQWHSAEQLVKFFVAFSGDTRPKRALVFAYKTNSWWLEVLPVEIGASCRQDLSGRSRVLYGGENDLILLSQEGTSDIVSTALRGTVTSSTSTTLTDSTAAFTTSVLDAPVAIIEGTGKGQLRRISARTGTELTVSSAWTTNPSTDSVYLVGAIEWSWRSGLFKLASEAEMGEAQLVFFPVTNTGTLDFRRYMNYATTPENNDISQSQGLVTTTIDDPDMVVNIKSALDLGTSSGFVRLPFETGYDHWSETDRHLAVELRGYQGLDAVKVYRMGLTGVEP